MVIVLESTNNPSMSPSEWGLRSQLTDKLLSLYKTGLEITNPSFNGWPSSSSLYASLTPSPSCSVFTNLGSITDLVSNNSLVNPELPLISLLRSLTSLENLGTFNLSSCAEILLSFVTALRTLEFVNASNFLRRCLSISFSCLWSFPSRSKFLVNALEIFGLL